MAEEKEPIPTATVPLAGRFICVCSTCNNHDSNGSIEFNFREMAVFYVCSQCKKMNKLELETKKQPYPRGRVGLRNV